MAMASTLISTLGGQAQVVTFALDDLKDMSGTKYRT